MRKIVLFAFIVAISSCNRAQEKTARHELLISNANIIDVRTGTIVKEQNIVIDSGSITQVIAEPQPPENFDKHIDASGKYIIPGLAEMHAHIPPTKPSQERLEEILFLYLSNGITTIRGMLGAPYHLDLRTAVANGTVLGPRIFTSSPSLNGNSVTSKEEAVVKVTAYQKEGYDFLKIHPGIKRDVFDTLVQTANHVGIRFAGHVPVDVGIQHALESNYASIDHIDGFLEGLVPKSEQISPEENGFFGFNFTALADTTKIESLVKLSKEHEVWIVPTQSLFERWFSPTPVDSLMQQVEMQYMPATTLTNWRNQKIAFTDPNAGFDADQWNHFISIRKKLLKALQDDGHGILLGSDAPQVLNVPGFSIHHEIAAMERAGLTPLEIIQSGTLNPAKFFGMENIFGEIKEGLAADLIILDDNPLNKLSALQQITGVLVQGKWLSKEMIDQKLSTIAKNAANN
ncbi:amidohydrolase family protein [Flagellimonas flava]|uniref:Imidazolonepropionase n=1 Tax=Flagellimonas flava TaxID=570519 RepID=A0A1M5I2Y0_9FLAO|nr:amidohydrolase family protein [Allomuricauda flava]SHG22626.1 Imidazolonepropionase [Allomuricauda flava]